MPIAPAARLRPAASILAFVARSPKETPWPSPLPPALMRWLLARGVDPSLLGARLGLPDDVAARDEVAVTPHGLEELLEAAAALVGEPYLALQLPTELPFRRYGLHELAARASGTVREAMQRVQRYASLIHPRMEFAFDESDGEARWRQRMLGYPRGVGRASHEYGLASALGHLRRNTQPSVAARRVWFMHARPRDLVPLYRFFGTRELSFGCDDNGLAFDATLLDAATEGDPRLLATVEPLAEAALRAQPRAIDFSVEVATRIRASLPDGANVEAVAAAMHMSARTLQRRLNDAGAQFSEVLDEVRADEAKRALTGSDAPLAEIGWRLGFADLATFSRAFKRWTGKPPGMYRRGS
jgi:AraC-like DNA-binding protein